MRLRPVIRNITLTAVNKEEFVNFATDVTSITIQCETSHDIRVAFESGKSVTGPKITIKKKGSLGEPGIQYSGNIYFSCNDADAFVAFPSGINIEILAWEF